MPEQRQLATWNQEADRWETDQETIFGHSVAYSETWPLSGTMQNGVAYALPMWEHHTEDLESFYSQRDEGRNLPTPTTRDWKDNQIRREPHRPNDTDTLARALNDPLLRTPTAQEAGGGHDAPGESPQRGANGSAFISSSDNCQPWPIAKWGDYGQAIERWQRIHGGAPAPVEQRENGKYRLNAGFAEWMMGLEPGHVTGVPGVTRNEQLKAIGNGVQPQQAIAALEDMLNARK